MRTKFIFIILIFIQGCLSPSTTLMQKAEELTRQQKYDEAIATYREHMQQRLNADSRPDWENPYFYLILIGDIQLGTKKPDEALKTYLEADQQKVDPYLVSDRLRSVARYYESVDDLQKAVDVLSKYRERDPLLFDAYLDRISKELVRREDEKFHSRK